MTLTKAYVQVYGQISEFFKTIQQGQAPEQFTQQLLKDLGFRSSNHRAFIPLLKELGFLSAEGIPAERYHEYRSEATAPQIMAEALRETYSEIFVISEYPTDEDRNLIMGKFKSTHNVSERLSELMTKTFYALLELADLKKKTKPKPKVTEIEKDKEKDEKPVTKPDKEIIPPGLYYNIQIHLPATKDIEVYNAIFKSLKEHIFD